MLLLLLACTSPKHPAEKESPPSIPAWDTPATAISCAPGGAAPLLEEAFKNANLARDEFGYTDDEWEIWDNLVENPYVLSWFPSVHHNPEQVPCFAGQLQADVDTALAQAHPVAAALSAWAAYVDVPLSGDPPNDSSALSDVLLRMPAPVEDPVAAAASLDPDLAAALVPILSVIADTITVRASLEATAIAYSDRIPGRLFSGGSGIILAGLQDFPDYRDEDELSWFSEWYHAADGPRTALTLAARSLAFAVEEANLSRFKGMNIEWVFHTSAGAIRISPSSNDSHDDSDGATLFQLELGGNDSWLGGAGATYDMYNPVSVVVDLDGNDHYGYVEVADPNDTAKTLPSDEAGRKQSGGYYISASDTGRQGSGRWGIGMLFDLGGGNDAYASLRMSQGFGSMGVGVLYDDAGDDSYAGEAGVQGSGIFGVGLLLDGGGNDSYTAWAYAQGFGYAGSGGLLADAGDGNDIYWSDPGNNYGGTTLYASPQLPNGEGNSSFTQGAGFGLRGDAYNVYLAGGLGMLRDGGGDDAYSGGVFTQGTGYWEGTGLLADAAGNDKWNALYYAEGGAAHYALGILVDGGGDDQHNTDFSPYYMMLGAGHDYSVGVLIDESGNDTVVVPGLALGASNCQGRGVYVDNDGEDTYLVNSTYSTGLGNHSGECESRKSYTGSNAIFLDSGGDADTYSWPDESRAPADNSSFGISWSGTPDEHGGAVDGDGESGFHARY
jgi:hypothetical protein